ncbi:hypothetical protein RFI_03366, partial [Reticulomyxa filosa]
SSFEENDVIWKLQNGGYIAISLVKGQFTIRFWEHHEVLEILYLGTDWVELSNSVFINSKYSLRANLSQSNTSLPSVHPTYHNLKDVALIYLHAHLGRIYEIRIKSPHLEECFNQQLSNLLFVPLRNVNVDKDGASCDKDRKHKTTPYIRAAAAYFGPKPAMIQEHELHHEIKTEEDGRETHLKQNCNIQKTLASGVLLFSEAPSDFCEIPRTLKQAYSQKSKVENVHTPYVILAERGGCTFLNKAQQLEAYLKAYPYANISSLIIGNVEGDGNIFTMASDESEQTSIHTLMIDKLSYHALKLCDKEITEPSQKYIEIVQVLARCQENVPYQFNVHGSHVHFYLASLSSQEFVVKQNGYVNLFLKLKSLINLCLHI